MLFLIQYDRATGTIVSLKEFQDGERRMANDARLELELMLRGGVPRQEVVLLEADSQDALRRTHRRFFEEVAALMRTPSEGSVTFEDQ